MASDSKPVIAWDNLSEWATISSSNATGGAAVNAGDWRPYVRWITGSSAGAVWWKIDCGAQYPATGFGICGHNLNSIGVADLILEGSDDDAAWTTIVAAFAPSTDKSLLVTFGQVSYQYYRVSFTVPGVTAPEIGIIFIGPTIQFEEYCLPFDPDGLTPTVEGNVATGGALLGVTRKYYDRVISVPFDLLDRVWVETEIFPLEKEHHPKPFFWAWELTNHPGEVYLMRLTQSHLSHPIRFNMRDVTLEMQGVMEE